MKAGLLEKIPDIENPPVPEGPATTGETQAHCVDTPDDPMKEMQIAFAGDQLTRVRFAGAKDLLSGSHTPVGMPVRMAAEVISIQNGGGMLTSSVRRAYGVRTKVGRLRKHSVLKSDWFPVKLVILTCRGQLYKAF